ncbi:MAG: hypothetical protein EB127_17205 [Alphaproteobacteria bacterium]|nr:hypothetical protein [Alphaproteobacteria bacterium]
MGQKIGKMRCLCRLFCTLVCLWPYYQPQALECVVLVHGFGKGAFSMGRFNSYFTENGYKTIAVNYASRLHDIKYIAENEVMPQIESESSQCSQIHFVGFSMGGVITRYILAFHRPNNLGRVVFIGSPHSGTELLDYFGRYRWITGALGPAAMDLHPESNFLSSVPDYVDYPAGVISGNFTLSPLGWFVFSKMESDGTVSVESSKVKGMSDHIVLKTSHTRLPYSPRVLEETLHFISKGKFRASADIDANGK